MRIAALGAIMALLVCPAVAWAGVVEDQVADARAAIVNRDYKAANKALDAAIAAAPGSETVVEGRTLAQIWYYRGLIEQLQGDKKGKAIDLWRQALVFDNALIWETSLLRADDPETLFEALRSEVRSRDKVDVGVPEKTGLAKLYVDGEQREAGARVLNGQHLAQIACPDNKVVGVWTDFLKPVKWFAMCPGGVDTSVEVVEAPKDDWAEFGPAFGTPSLGGSAMLNVPYGDEQASGEPAPATPVAEAPVATAPVTPVPVTPAPVTPAPEPTPPTPPPVVETPVATAPVATPPPEIEAPVVTLAPDPPPAVEPPVVAEVTPPDVTPATPVVTEPIPSSGGGRDRGGLAGTVLLAGGGALLAGGVAVNFVMVNPTWAEIEAARDNPRSVSRDQADALTSRFNTVRALTLGLLGGGVALTGVGVFLESPVAPVLGPGQIGLSGRF